MLWIKSLHIFFMVTWFCGLFYLPRLFVYHAMADDTISIERFKIMERKLYFGIATPGAILTLVFGIWLLLLNPFFLIAPWFHLKLLLVLLTIIYHIYLGCLWRKFKNNQNKHGHIFYRIINEIPVLFLLGIIILVVVQPNLFSS